MWRRAFSSSALLGFGWGGVQKEGGGLVNVGSASISHSNIKVFRPEAVKGDVLISRKVVNELDKTKLNLRLYQYETCPFCCKCERVIELSVTNGVEVRAFLDYYGFSYEVVEVNPVTRSQIKFFTDYKKVPILRSNEDFTLTESSLVVSQLATLLALPGKSLSDVIEMYPVVPSVDEKGKPISRYPNKYFLMQEKTLSPTEMAAAKEEREWRTWVDEHFIHLISPNVYRTWKESLDTFQWFQQVGDWHRTFPSWERCLAVYVGAAAMFALSKRLKKRHNIEDEREALREACDKWMEAIGPSRKFMGGELPNLADLALFGAMNSFYGTIAFKEVIESGKASEWYNSMKEVVDRREGQSVLSSRAAK